MGDAGSRAGLVENDPQYRALRPAARPLLPERVSWVLEEPYHANGGPKCVFKRDRGKETDLEESVERPEAWWRRMLVSQPPLGGISLEISLEQAEDYLVLPHGGVTMESLWRSWGGGWDADMLIDGVQCMEVWEDEAEVLRVIKAMKGVLLR